MRKIRKNKQMKIIIISFLGLMLFLCVGYAAFNTNLSLKAKGNIKEKSRVIQSWTGIDQTDFHSDFYKENIVSVTFLDNNKVPNNAIETWNVSEDKENGGVLAWVIPHNQDNTKYDLYVGAKDGVIANSDSSNLFSEFLNIEFINFNNNFDTSNVTTMVSMFSNFDYDLGYSPGNALKSINFGDKFVTENVIYMSHMFMGCTSLETLDLSNFDTSKVTKMNGMFSRCYSLKELDLSNFDTSNVTTMQDMFDYSSLSEINLCSFNTHKVTTMESMFAGSTNLRKVYVGVGWSTTGVNTTRMFNSTKVSSVTYGEC